MRVSSVPAFWKAASASSYFFTLTYESLNPMVTDWFRPQYSALPTSQGTPASEGQVGVTGAIDEDLGLDLHLAALRVGDDRLDPAVLDNAVGHVHAVEDAAAGLQQHLLQLHLAHLGLDHGQVRPLERRPLGGKPVDPLLAEPLHHARRCR